MRKTEIDFYARHSKEGENREGNKNKAVKPAKNMMKKKGRMKMKLQKMLAAVMAASMVFTAVPVMNGVNVSAASTDKIDLNGNWISIHSYKNPSKNVANQNSPASKAVDKNYNTLACGGDTPSRGETDTEALVRDGDSLYYELDLQAEYQLSNLKMWRYWNDGRTYYDTIIVASEDATFNDGNDTIIFNAATEDRSCGFGAGSDQKYTETSNGKDFPQANGVKARYIRVYMAGHNKGVTADQTRNGGCHLNELEVYGAKVHTVTFNDKVDGTDDTTVEVLSGDKLTMPEPPTREGYTFTGWYTNDTCTTQYNNDAQSWTNSDGDLTLYAGWKANLTGITVTGQFAKNIFTQNEDVDLSGFTVSTVYTNNEGNADVTTDATVSTTLNTATLGQQSVTVTATYTVSESTKPLTATTDQVNVKVIDGNAKAALDAAITEADAVDTVNVKYSETSKSTFENAKADAKALQERLENVADVATTDDNGTVTKNLTDAIDGLEELYKVAVPAGVTIEASNGALPETDDSGSYVYVPALTKVTVKADKESNGQKFAAWLWNGQKLSETNEYTFYAVGNMEVKPTYNKEEIREEIVKFACSTKFADNRRCFIAKRSVSKAYKVKEYGVVITDQKGWDKNYAANVASFVKGATRTKCTYKKDTVNPNNGTFEARLKCGRTEKWYGRAYVIYEAKDGTGEPVTVYSDVIQY